MVVSFVWEPREEFNSIEGNIRMIIRMIILRGSKAVFFMDQIITQQTKGLKL